MKKSISYFQYNELQKETMASTQKIDTYEIELQKYITDNSTGEQSISKHVSNAKALIVDGVDSFVFLNPYDDECIVVTKDELLKEPIFIKTSTLDDLKNKKEESDLAIFMKKKQKEIARADINEKMVRESSFDRLESQQKLENRKIQMKLNFMNDFGFSPLLEIDLEKENGKITLEFKDGDIKTIPLQLVENEDISLNFIDDFKEKVYAIDIDIIEENNLFNIHFKNNKHLFNTIVKMEFINDDAYYALSENDDNSKEFSNYNVDSDKNVNFDIMHYANKSLRISLDKRKKNNKPSA